MKNSIKRAQSQAYFDEHDPSSERNVRACLAF